MKWALDVSRYDAATGKDSLQAVDWKRAKDEGGLSMAIIKCTEGTYKDPAFETQWWAAKGVVARAAYHFFRSNLNAIKQAQNFWSIVSAAGFKQHDFVVLDFETLDGMIPTKALLAAASWLYELEKYGTQPMIYTYPGFWKGAGGESATWAAKYPLMLAQWPKDNWILNYSPTVFTKDRLSVLKTSIENGTLKPVVLKPWASPAIWQFTSRVDTTAVPGHPAAKKVCDYNAVYMTLPEVSPVPDQPSLPPVDPYAEKRCPTCGQVIHAG
jgi:hypothetical protein